MELGMRNAECGMRNGVGATREGRNGNRGSRRGTRCSKFRVPSSDFVRWLRIRADDELVSRTNHAVGEDFAAQAAAPLEPGFCAGADRFVHPGAGAAFLDSEEAHRADKEFASDQGVEVDALGEEVAAHRRRGLRSEVVLGEQRAKDFEGEQGDLTFVVRLVVEEPVADQTAPGQALHGVHRRDGVFSGGESVTAEVVVSGGDEDVADCWHRLSGEGARESFGIEIVAPPDGHREVVRAGAVGRDS